MTAIDKVGKRKLKLLWIVIGTFIISASITMIKSWTINPLKYKYLFRKVILSESQQYELVPVLSGRVYKPGYFYLPAYEQYLVHSTVDKSGPFRFHKIHGESEDHVYVLLDAKGNIVRSFATELGFSTRSGSFYGATHYIPWIETGRTDSVPYDKIHNTDFHLDQKAFNQLLISLYNKAEYVEYISLKQSLDDDHQAGVVFKQKGRVELLLSGLRDRRLQRRYLESDSDNSLQEYFFTGTVANGKSYLSSPPTLKIQALHTRKNAPSSRVNHGSSKPFTVAAYNKQYSIALVGVAAIHGIPIFLPGYSEGTAYVNFKVNNDVFRIRILDVEKQAFIPAYNLGLRSLHLSENYQADPLVFMESGQNSGENRLGGGVYVVRHHDEQKLPSTDLPEGITEKQYDKLPVNLQAALMNPDESTELIIYDKRITTWLTEIERLKNLTHLSYETSITEIPAAIANLDKLEVLNMNSCNIRSVSPKIGALKALRKLDLSGNEIREFPASLLSLHALEVLDIGDNPITTLPDEIGQLQSLTYLSVYSTALHDLPRSLISLDQLYINANKTLSSRLSEEYQHLFKFSK